jgi:hypothetical protein
VAHFGPQIHFATAKPFCRAVLDNPRGYPDNPLEYGGNHAMSIFDEIPDDEGDSIPDPPFKPTVQKMRYTHAAIVDTIIANPEISQGELSKIFGFTQAWMSIIVNSSGFKELLAERKAVFVDPKIQASVNDRLDALARRSLDILLERVENASKEKTADLISMAKLGVGDANSKTPLPVQTNLYVVNLPPQAKNAISWAENAQGRKVPVERVETIENVGRVCD